MSGVFIHHQNSITKRIRKMIYCIRSEIKAFLIVGKKREEIFKPWNVIKTEKNLV